MLKVWESISELEETPWSTAVPRKIRKSLDAVQEGMRNLPNRVRQYEPFEYAQVTRISFSHDIQLITLAIAAIGSLALCVYRCTHGKNNASTVQHRQRTAGDS